MVTRHRSSAELRAIETCKACVLFTAVKSGAGLCLAHGKAVKESDFRCSTHFKRASGKVSSASA